MTKEKWPMLIKPEHQAAIDGFIQKLDRSVITSGILHMPYGSLSQIENFKGDADTGECSLINWRQIYYEMEKGSVGGRSLSSFADFIEQAEQSVKEGVIPIGILNLHYHRFRQRIVASIISKLKRGEELGPEPDNLATLVQEARVFVAAPLWHQTVTGASLTFEVGGPWYVGNTGEQLIVMEIDFDDGAGWRSVTQGARIHIGYQETGDKQIRLRAHFAGQVLEARSTFTVSNLEVPLSSMDFEVEPVDYRDVTVTGRAYVWFGAGHSSIVKPIILVSGFDPQNSLTPQAIYNLLNREHLVTEALKNGYDLVILHYGNGGTYIGGNGRLLENLIAQIESMPSKTEPSVIIGASMGGLVARYALARMEKYGRKHGARLYLSIDTPHQGAEVPMCVQYFLDYFGNRGSAEALKSLNEILNCKAAREMLVYHYVPDWTNQEIPAPDPLFKKFFAELEEVGDRPSHLRRIAIANGSGDATQQDFGPGALLLEWNGSEVWSNPLAAMPKEGQERLVFEGFQCGHTKWWAYVKVAKPYDSAPGGKGDFIDRVAKGIRATERGTLTVHHDKNCFVPSVSAIDKRGANLYDKLNGAVGTWFDAVYYPTGKNEDHVDINSDNATWIKKELGITKAAKSAKSASSK